MIKGTYDDATGRELFRATGGLAALAGICAHAQQSVGTAAHTHARGRVHRLATLATVLAEQGDAEHTADTAMQMLDQATGMESRRAQERIISVHDAMGGMADKRARLASWPSGSLT